MNANGAQNWKNVYVQVMYLWNALEDFAELYWVDQKISVQFRVITIKHVKIVFNILNADGVLWIRIRIPDPVQVVPETESVLKEH